jgi:hypothetical protein
MGVSQQDTYAAASALSLAGRIKQRPVTQLLFQALNTGLADPVEPFLAGVVNVGDVGEVQDRGPRLRACRINITDGSDDVPSETSSDRS